MAKQAPPPALLARDVGSGQGEAQGKTVRPSLFFEAGYFSAVQAGLEPKPACFYFLSQSFLIIAVVQLLSTCPWKDEQSKDTCRLPWSTCSVNT